MLLYPILACTTHEQKSHTKTKKLKYQLRCGMKNLDYLMDHILHQIFKIILGISSKKHQKVTDNPPIKIYINKIECWITFRIKGKYYLEVLTPEMMKLFGSTKSKIYKDKNGENVLHLEITEALFVHCDIANNNYQQNFGVLHIFVPVTSGI